MTLPSPWGVHPEQLKAGLGRTGSAFFSYVHARLAQPDPLRPLNWPGGPTPFGPGGRAPYYTRVFYLGVVHLYVAKSGKDCSFTD